MNAYLRERANVNLAIVCSVFVHVACVLLAATFRAPWFTRIAAASGVALYFIGGPALWLWHRSTLPARQGEGLSDIRDVTAAASALAKYDPEPYFAIDRGVFVGLDIDKNSEPVYVPWNRLRKTHMQVVGTTGSGKGVATTMMLTQCALAGECVVVFDPKFPGDEFAPKVFYRFAQQHGIPFYLLNLSPQMPAPLDRIYPVTPPQLNLFNACSTSEVEELLTTAFRLEATGSNADHYRLHDRLACKDVSHRATANGRIPNVRDLLAAANQSRRIDDEKGADFKANLEEVASLPVLQTQDGYDLKAILDQNAILYIIGSIRNATAKRVQKMLLLRLMQLIEQRDRNKPLRPVAMMLDELKYLLSQGALQALGTVRDKGCHIFLAHQTLGDLRDCEGLDAEAVTAAVKGNTSLKLIYRVTDPDDTGKWAENLSGTIIVTQQSTHMQQRMFAAAEGQFRQTERPLLTINELLALPDQTGMFFGIGLSRRIQVGPMKVGEYPTITTAMPLEAAQPKQSRKQRKDVPATTTTQTPEETEGQQPVAITAAMPASETITNNIEAAGSAIETTSLPVAQDTATTTEDATTATADYDPEMEALI